MFDVSNKDEILHKATSQSIIRVLPETIDNIKNNKLFEANLIESAKISATLAAKKTWEIVPHSHQKTIDYVNVEISLRSELIEIVVEVKGLSKSSLAIESITAASSAAITIFDKLRSLGDSISIESIRLLRESNVVSESKEQRGKKVKAAVLVIGNVETLEEKEDQIKKFTVDKLGDNDFEVIESKAIEADSNLIESNIKKLCDESNVDFVITCGGIELKSKNIVSEVTAKLLEKNIEGIPEMLRAYGVKRIPSTILYRGVAGIRGKSVIINLSENIGEISESLDLLFPYLLHINKIVERT